MTPHGPARIALLATAAAGCLLIGGCGTTAGAAGSTAAASVGAGAAGTSAAGGTVASGAAVTVAAGTTSAAPPALSAPTTSSAAAAPTAPSAAAVDGPSAASVAVAAPAATGGATSACALITEQEATLALGADPGPGHETSLGDIATACSYFSGESSLQFSLTTSGGKAKYDQEQAQMSGAAPGTGADIAGIGDNAFGQFKGSRAAINFDKGDTLVVIGLNIAGAAEPPRDAVTVLATAAAGRV